MRGGGTWLGMTPRGRIAFLTNVREASSFGVPVAARSRGELVLQWLEGDMTVEDFMSGNDPQAYGGFNLIVADWKDQSWTWLGNRPVATLGKAFRGEGRTGTGWCYRQLEPGIYGLSNAALDTRWPKTIALKDALKLALETETTSTSAEEFSQTLGAALLSRDEADQKSLPTTGVPLEIEKALSSAFIYAPQRRYGTRSSTVVIAKRDYARPNAKNLRLSVTEQTFHMGDSVDTQGDFKNLDFNWPL